MNAGLCSHDMHFIALPQDNLTEPGAPPRSISDLNRIFWQLLGVMLSEQEGGGGDDIEQTGCYVVTAATMRDAQKR